MGTITVSLPADQTTADVADYNTPITTVVNLVNGNIDNANIATDAAIAGSKLGTGTAGVGNAQLNTTAGDIGGAWKSYTMTTANITPGTTGLVNSARYTLIGKTCHVAIYFVFGTGGSASGEFTFSLPFAAANNGVDYVGTVDATDAGTGYRVGICIVSPTGTTIGMVSNALSTFWNATTPHTWAATDSIRAQITYEIA